MCTHLPPLSIQLSLLIPEYCSHFSPPLLPQSQVALVAFFIEIQGVFSGVFGIAQVQKQRAIIPTFSQKATLRCGLWKQAV